MAKYTLDRNEKKMYQGHTVYRIIYNDGTKGGWLQSEANLSQDGECKVLDDAVVFGSSIVQDNAIVYDRALVNGGKILGRATIAGSASISGPVVVSDNASVYGNAFVKGSVVVDSNARVNGNASVHAVKGSYLRSPAIRITGRSRVCGNAKVSICCTCHSLRVLDDAVISGNSAISGNVLVYAVLNDVGSVNFDCDTPATVFTSDDLPKKEELQPVSIVAEEEKAAIEPTDSHPVETAKSSVLSSLESAMDESISFITLWLTMFASFVLCWPLYVANWSGRFVHWMFRGNRFAKVTSTITHLSAIWATAGIWLPWLASLVF